MLVQLVTDNHIEGRAKMAEWVEAEVTGTLDRYADQITRVEVHFADENSHKSGQVDKRCTVECRLAGLDPLAATEHAGGLDEALEGALAKLLAVLDHKLGRLREHKGRTSYGGEPTE